MNIDLVKVPPSVLNNSKRLDVIEIIVKQFTKAVKVRDHLNPDQIHYIALLIENLISKKDGIDKFDIFVEICKQLYPTIGNDEIEMAHNVINHLLQIKAIRKIPILKKALAYSWEIFKKVAVKFFL